ncbi:DsrE family protein [Sulfurovum sp.]|uniref:DsrE family protein n=1 Tax=Sulfurovum sp. TaxID=1969726 RepID=UPI002868152E|nr:DsrE family protein [Sulfurovum sp.]
MKYLVIAFILLFNIGFAETEFAEPKPTIDNPRKIVFSIISGDAKEINHVLSSVNNVMKFYRPENTEIAVVAYSQGINAVLKNGDVDIRKRVEALMTYDVVFIACGNTMRTLKIENKDLLDDVEVVTAGIVEIIEKQLQGYVYIQP